MNNDDQDDWDEDDWDEDSISDDEVEQIVQTAIGDLLNIAAGVAELQLTLEAAEDIYAMCDLVAEYHGIERAEIETIDNGDGSFTTRPVVASTLEPTTTAYTGHVRNHGKLKFRVIDKNTRSDFDDDDDE